MSHVGVVELLTATHSHSSSNFAVVPVTGHSYLATQWPPRLRAEAPPTVLAQRSDVFTGFVLLFLRFPACSRPIVKPA